MLTRTVAQSTIHQKWRSLAGLASLELTYPILIPFPASTGAQGQEPAASYQRVEQGFPAAKTHSTHCCLQSEVFKPQPWASCHFILWLCTAKCKQALKTPLQTIPRTHSPHVSTAVPLEKSTTTPSPKLMEEPPNRSPGIAGKVTL